MRITIDDRKNIYRISSHNIKYHNIHYMSKEIDMHYYNNKYSYRLDNIHNIKYNSIYSHSRHMCYSLTPDREG